MRRGMVAVSALLLSACAPGPDTVLLNGKIFTANPAQPWAEALAIRGDRIVAVGGNADIAGQVGASTQRLDLGGRTVIPGLNDAYVLLPDPTRASVRVLAADAMASGLTSLQAFSPGPVAEAVRVLRETGLPLRIRVSRMPQPDAAGVNRDSRPYFPPQPGPRLDARGMGFVLRAGDSARVLQAVGWAYGSEDPLAVRGLDPQTIEAYVAAIEKHGAAEVWRAKRPRLVQPASLPATAAERLLRLGVIVVQAPREGFPLRSLLDAGIPLALGSDPSSPGLAVIRSATAAAVGREALTSEEAITAYTQGSALAEFTEREKGQLAVGMLADLAVLSADVFTVPNERMEPIRSVLTMIGGRVVHETGVVR